MNLRDLFLRIRALVVRRRVERELDEELSFHIARETQKHIAAGLSPADAHTLARARFGSLPLAADQCRDVRGTGFVDDLTRDVLYALRTLRRAPLAALTIVATVTLGLGLVAAVFSVYNFFLLRVDAVQSPNELFAVAVGPWTGPDNRPDVVFTRRDYEAMRRETSVFTDAFAMQDAVTRLESRLARSNLVTANFFQVLGVEAALGRSFRPGDDERGGGQPGIVLSDVGWRKLFRGDPAVIGRRVVIDGAPNEIVGVMPDGFRGLRINPPDYWAALALVEEPGDDAVRRDENAVEIVGRLRPGVSRTAATAALALWASGRTEFNKVSGNRVPVRLTPRQGTLPTDDVALQLSFVPLFFAFGLILAIGCAERRQPAPRARRRAPAGDRHPLVTWRLTPAHHPAVAHREPPACARGGRRRSSRRAGVSRERPFSGDDDDTAGVRAVRKPAEPGRPCRGLAGADLPGGWRRGIDRVLRPRTSAAGHPPQRGANHAG